MKDAIMLTAKLYDYRDTAKRFFKDDFQNKIAPYQKIIRGVMEKQQLEVIPALLKISKTELYESDGMIQLLFVAAATELMEQRE
jgi:hypothetical protein